MSTQISSELMGMLYVMDEPSIGLHPRDSDKVIDTIKKLRDIGNTVIVVEHDVDTIRSADYIVEIGPGGHSRRQRRSFGYNRGHYERACLGHGHVSVRQA